MHTLTVFLIFCFTCYSFVNLLIYFDGPFDIFAHIRNLAERISDKLAELFRCQACCSTWVAFFISALNLVFIPSIPFTPFNMILGETGLWWLIILLDGLCGSGTTWLMFRLEDYLTIKVNQSNDNGEQPLLG